MTDPLTYVLRNVYRLAQAPRRRAALRAFRAVTIRPGDIAIDCGANVGEVTAELAARGARVYAFEPNPVAFDVLAQKFDGHPRVSCLLVAVSDHSGRDRLYLHRRFLEDPLGHSAGSSLLASKGNLDTGRSITVNAVDLAGFIRGLDQRVRILKLDIEGWEFTVLNHLIDTGAIHAIDHVFCETHEFKAPGLARRRRQLRRRLNRAGIHNVNLDWK